MTRIGGYQIISRIAQGGMATVYLAQRPDRADLVALKVLSPRINDDPESLARFEREAHIISTLIHPHIVPVYDSGVDEDRHYIAMKYLNYGTLRDRLDKFAQRGEPMPVAEVLEVGRQIATALDYAHKRGVIHRDVKPNNILLAPGGRYVLSDFGVVFVQGASRITRNPGQMLGTAEYMSPEQAEQKPIDLRVDIYALGIVLYELLTGNAPFKNDTDMLVLYAHVNQVAKPIEALRPDVPRAVVRIIERAMHKQPDARFGTAGELALAIEDVVASLAQPNAQSRPRYLAVTALVLLITVVAVTIFFVSRVIQSVPVTNATALPTEAKRDVQPMNRQFNLAQVIYTADDSGADVFEHPGLHARRVSHLTAGTRVHVLGRTPDGKWLWIKLSDKSGWVLNNRKHIGEPLNTVPYIPALTKP